MARISVRKTQPTPAPDAEVLEDTTEDQAASPAGQKPDDQAPQASEPTGFLRGLAAGIHGWWHWCSNLIGTSKAYALHAVAIWAAAHYSQWVTWAMVIALAAAVVTFMPASSIDRIVDRFERRHAPTATEPDAPEAEEEPQQPADPLTTLLWQLIGDAPGVHLKTLVKVLAEAATRQGRPAPTRAHVEAELEARRIPLRPSVRDARGKVNRGVHRDDLAAALQTPPPAPGQGLAQDP
ncbi:hypothetical protein ACF09J_07755 [Streptomyces sp. NPDC014889]|uniref:hypothetical protein n=1 Tax=Streptomyces sp. NPDC014889 TaxID=3364928 RepID=UPI0036FBCCD1